MSRIVKPVICRHIRTLGATSSGSRPRSGKVLLVLASEEHMPVLESIRDSLDFEMELVGSRFISHPRAVEYVADMMGICDATLICMHESPRIDALKSAVEPFKDELKIISIGVDASVWSLTTVDRRIATQCYRNMLEGGESGYIRMMETAEIGLGWKHPGPD